jgi:AcrR family transcriptional regulator
MTTVDEPIMTSRGRPRDPQLEDRVFDAAISLYAEAGWAGFNFDAIARRAGVGKAALYRRWPSRGELLRQTFEVRWYVVDRIDTGSLHGDLTELARMCLESLTGPHGGAAAFMAVDWTRHPEVRLSTAPYRESTVRQGRAMVRRAVTRGEVAESVNPGLLLDIVVGAISNHVDTTPVRMRNAMIAKSPQFIDSLVETVLRGVQMN